MATAMRESIENRLVSRFSTDFVARGTNARLGDLKVKVTNLSAMGYMIEGDLDLQRGERLEIQLPGLGCIDSHLVWANNGRAGFQFERIIRLDQFLQLVSRVKKLHRS